jgi:signal peptidase I
MAVAAAVWWVRSRLLLVTIDGRSMEPSLHDGDRVLVWRTSADRIRRGEIVIVAEPRSIFAAAQGGPGLTVKRVAACAGDPVPEMTRTDHLAPGFADGCGRTVPSGTVVLLGDNPAESIDSRHYGPVPSDLILGRVRRRLTSSKARTLSSVD